MITAAVLKAMARSLNLEDNCFLDQCGKRPTVTARFNYYPKCPRPELVHGVKPHADASAITVLLQDEVEGLKLQKDDQWFRVPTIPQAFLINAGDLVEVTITETDYILKQIRVAGLMCKLIRQEISFLLEKSPPRT